MTRQEWTNRVQARIQQITDRFCLGPIPYDELQRQAEEVAARFSTEMDLGWYREWVTPEDFADDEIDSRGLALPFGWREIDPPWMPVEQVKP